MVLDWDISVTQKECRGTDCWRRAEGAMGTQMKSHIASQKQYEPPPDILHQEFNTCKHTLQKTSHQRASFQAVEVPPWLPPRLFLKNYNTALYYCGLVFFFATACRILVLQPGIELRPLAVGAQSPNQ